MISFKLAVTSSGVMLMKKQNKNEDGHILNIPAATAYPEPVIHFSQTVML